MIAQRLSYLIWGKGFFLGSNCWEIAFQILQVSTLPMALEDVIVLCDFTCSFYVQHFKSGKHVSMSAPLPFYLVGFSRLLGVSAIQNRSICLFSMLHILCSARSNVLPLQTLLLFTKDGRGTVPKSC
uniref:Uncharacterized protein n=1 Tax=Micrurus surinamensis TaxID=129470 RepID=A0A2D4P8E3_MICSU